MPIWQRRIILMILMRRKVRDLSSEGTVSVDNEWSRLLGCEGGRKLIVQPGHGALGTTGKQNA